MILFHAGLAEMSGGYIGVDIFFVISGFLITGVIVREQALGELSLRRFYHRRVRRLFPALALTVSGTLLFGALILDPALLEETGNEAISTVLCFSNFHFYRTSGYFDVQSELKPLRHMWSLSLEEQFYMLWPALLILLHRSRSLVRWGPVVLALASLLASELVIEQDPSAAFYLLPTRMFELMLGSILVLWERKRADVSRTGFWSEVSAGLGLAFLVFAIHQFDAQTRFPGLPALGVSLATVAVIFGGQSRWVGSVLRLRPIAFVGKISYSAYLVHWPLIVFGGYVRRRDLDREEALVILATSLFLAAVMHRFVETPFRRLNLKAEDPTSSRRFLLGCAAVAAGLVAVSGDIVRSQGWPWRVEPARLAPKESAVRHGYEPCGLSTPACRIGIERETVDFAILGDSHARHFAHGLDDLAKRHEYAGIVLTHSACALLEGAMTKRKGVLRRDCVAGTEKAFQQIDELQANLVFVTQAYLGYASAFCDEEGQSLTFSTQRELGKHWVSLLDATVGRLRRPGRKFIILLTTLRPEYDPARCVRRPRSLEWLEPPEECARSDSDAMLQKARDIESLIVAWARENPDVSVLDPKTVQCPRGQCVIARGAELHYEDDNHLSAAGSRFIIAGLEAEILAALRAVAHRRPPPDFAPRLWGQ